MSPLNPRIQLLVAEAPRGRGWVTLPTPLHTLDATGEPGGRLQGNTLEVTIQGRQAKGWPVVMGWRDDGGLRLTEKGALVLNQKALLRAVDRRSYGEALGRALFHDGLLSAFDRALTATDCLHVLLVIEDPALRELRWERLCAPLDGGWKHLALGQRAPLSIYEPSVATGKFPGPTPSQGCSSMSSPASRQICGRMS